MLWFQTPVPPHLVVTLSLLGEVSACSVATEEWLEERTLAEPEGGTGAGICGLHLVWTEIFSHTAYMTNPTASGPINALAYADSKGKLNLFEASLFRSTYNTDPRNLGLRDLDRAYGRIIGSAEAHKHIRL